jgi:hypothetical protein
MSVLASPLDFVFKGYSIWLELDQVESDLDKAVEAAALDLHVHAIPVGDCGCQWCGNDCILTFFNSKAPHVTVIYGISHLSEDECLKRFREDLATRVQAWQELRVKGFKVCCCDVTTVDFPISQSFLLLPLL